MWLHRFLSRQVMSEPAYRLLSMAVCTVAITALPVAILVGSRLEETRDLVRFIVFSLLTALFWIQMVRVWQDWLAYRTLSPRMKEGIVENPDGRGADPPTKSPEGK